MFSHIWKILSSIKTVLKKNRPVKIENLNSNYELFRDHATTVAFEGGHDLRKQLKLDEDNYRYRAPYSHKNTRDIFIYQAIDEAQKSATCLMRWEEFFSEDSTEISSQQGEDTKQQVIRITRQAVLEEQSLRSRKLTEILVDMILFLNTNEDIYFKDYFYFHELYEYQNYQSDRNEFFDFKSNNSECHIKWLREQILNLERNGLEIEKRWYLNEPKSISSLKKIRLSTFKAKYIKISLFQNAEIVTLLGKSYLHAYGESRQIHFSPNDTSASFKQNNPSLNANKVAVLLVNLLLKAQELSHLSSSKIDKLVPEIKPDDEDTEFYKELTTSQANFGDYVLANGVLGQVIEEKKSKYGYFAYNIRYLGVPPLEETPDDWFASFEIKKLGSKTELLKNVKSVISEHTDIDTDLITSVDDKHFEQCLSQSINEVLKLIN